VEARLDESRYSVDRRLITATALAVSHICGYVVSSRGDASMLLN
jgi:hypothetical protein